MHSLHLLKQDWGNCEQALGCERKPGGMRRLRCRVFSFCCRFPIYIYTALTALYVSLSKDGPDLCYSGRATQWEFLGNSYNRRSRRKRRLWYSMSVCSATDRLWTLDALLLPGYKNREKRQVRVHISEAKERTIKRINLQSTRRWSISVWLNRWLLISMVTCWSVLRCQVAIGSGSCQRVCGCVRSRWLHLIAGARTLKSWERRRDHTGDLLL